MKGRLGTRTLCALLLASGPCLAAWDGDAISGAVIEPGGQPGGTYDWPSPAAVVDFIAPEFVNQLTNVTISADFTADTLTLSYQNTSQFDNVTFPPLEFSFTGLDVGGQGIVGLEQVSSGFSSAITPGFTASSITLALGLQNTNPGDVFSATFHFSNGTLYEPDLVAVTADPEYAFDYYSSLGVTGGPAFTIDNLYETLLEIKSAWEPDVGLQPGELAQPGFAIYDGTLLLEAGALDPAGGRATLVNTYRMNVDPRMLRRDFLRARYLRQGVYVDRARALRAARAARLSDLRVMRYVEDEGRWVRAARVAVRADGRRAERRFLPRMAPDGVVGHYGTYVDGDKSIVWAVVPHNSRYGVGINSDDDNDGIFNANDNCRGDANTDQLDTDLDGKGNVCDGDDDADGVPDESDNCPLDANAGQSDQDGDGAGDACDSDADGDGVSGDIDQCPGTAGGAPVDAQGCSIDDSCPCGTAWKNHGAFVRCVAHRSEEFVEAGLISETEKDQLLEEAGGSTCGKP